MLLKRQEPFFRHWLQNETGLQTFKLLLLLWKANLHEMYSHTTGTWKCWSLPPFVVRTWGNSSYHGVWPIVAGRGSRVQSRGRGSSVAAGENDLEFEVTEWKRVIWKKYKGKKNRLYAWYSTVANLQVTDVRVNKIMPQEKT